ncbi:hypothetical protein D3C86_1427100 [compost metagenome]
MVFNFPVCHGHILRSFHAMCNVIRSQFCVKILDLLIEIDLCIYFVVTFVEVSTRIVKFHFKCFIVHGRSIHHTRNFQYFHTKFQQVAFFPSYLAQCQAQFRTVFLCTMTQFFLHENVKIHDR